MIIKKKTGADKVNDVCRSILALSDRDILEVTEIVNRRMEYSNPSDLEEQEQMRKLGEYNLNIIKSLLSLRALIASGENLRQKNE